MAYDISLTQGEDFNLTATLKNSDGTNMNLSGYNVRGKVKYNYGSDTYLLDLDPQIYSSASGIITVNLTAAETASLPITVAFYDIEKYTSGDNSVNKVLNGKMTICPEVTK